MEFAYSNKSLYFKEDLYNFHDFYTNPYIYQPVLNPTKNDQIDSTLDYFKKPED